jgi:hypothetical protein
MVRSAGIMATVVPAELRVTHSSPSTMTIAFAGDFCRLMAETRPWLTSAVRELQWTRWRSSEV